MSAEFSLSTGEKKTLARATEAIANAATLVDAPSETLVPSSPRPLVPVVLGRPPANIVGAADVEVGEEVLGEGGMGIVRLGKQPRLRRQVAVKALKESHCSTLVVEKLLQEAWFTSGLEPIPTCTCWARCSTSSSLVDPRTGARVCSSSPTRFSSATSKLRSARYPRSSGRSLRDHGARARRSLRDRRAVSPGPRGLSTPPWLDRPCQPSPGAPRASPHAGERGGWRGQRGSLRGPRRVPLRFSQCTRRVSGERGREARAARGDSAVIELELERNDPKAAEALLAALDEVPPELEARVAEHKARWEAEQGRIAALQAEAADRRIGGRTRVVVGVVLMVALTIAPLLPEPLGGPMGYGETHVSLAQFPLIAMGRWSGSRSWSGERWALASTAACWPWPSSASRSRWWST